MSKIFFSFFILVLSFSPAQALKSDWGKASHSKARILSAVQATGSGDSINAAVELELPHGWHTYWKIPGDAGLAPRFEWDGSDNIENVEISWPLPVRKVEQELFTVFSYGTKTVFPLQVKFKDPEENAALDLNLKFMVCKDICIPEQIQMRLDIPAGASKPSSFEKDISFAKLRVPQVSRNEHVMVTGITPHLDSLEIHTKLKRGYHNAPVVIAYTEEMVLTAKPVIEVNKADELIATVRIAKPEGVEDLKAALVGKNLHIIVSDGRSIVEQSFEL